MEASPSKIIQYFNGEKQNLIPLFQRPYKWNKDKWKTLWDDVMVQYDLGDHGTHFLGALSQFRHVAFQLGLVNF